MKIVFLGIDGVLNSVNYHRRRFAAVGLEPFYAQKHFDPEAVKVLNTIVERSGALMVISSTWRILETRTSMQGFLNAAGFKGTVLSMTPVLHVKRGLEIQDWLDKDAPRLAKKFGEVSHFVILDDDTDMEHLYPKLVHIDDLDGLTESYVPDILKHLE
jgi:hypothetical protein